MGNINLNPKTTTNTPTTWEKWRTVTIRNLKIGKMTLQTMSKQGYAAIKKQIDSLFHIKRKPDPYHLLDGKRKIRPALKAWNLNHGLMKRAQEKTNDPAVKEQLNFLSVSYLMKAAPIHLKPLEIFHKKFGKLFQVSPFSNYYYHRFSFLNKNGDQPFGLKKASPFIQTDTLHYGGLFKLKFAQFDQKLEDCKEDFFKTLQEHFLGGFREDFTKGLLFDLTPGTAPLLQMGQDAACQQYLKGFRQELDLLIKESVERLIQANPALKSHKKKMQQLIRKNIVAISRVESQEVKGIKILPIFHSVSQKRNWGNRPAFIRFMDLSGLYASIIQVRRGMAKTFSSDNSFQYNVKGESATYFPNKDHFIQKASFNRFLTKVANTKPHFAILGSATAKILQGLFTQVTEEKWNALQQDPARKEVLQNSLFQISIRLAEAEQHLEDFNRFSQAIELIHAELFTLLELLRPYEEEAFSPIYLNQLTQIPDSLKGHAKAGLGRCGMSVFAGINAALPEKDTCRVHGKGVYFELANFLGYENALENADKPVDLYLGQFNPGITTHGLHTHYTPNPVMKEIKKLIKPDMKPLTVVIDCTIESVNSPNVHTLLSTYEKEIQAGKLNCIFFRSGQKFDMFGMDNYYGAPFYMVNNGDKQWDRFNHLFHEETYKTDPLSTQWFCLSNQFAAKELDQYRQQIFKNTQEILKQVPEVLKPQKDNPNQKLRVNTADESLETCYLDIKVGGRFHRLRAYSIMAHLYKKSLENKVKVFSRANFGYYFINLFIFTVMEKFDLNNSSTIRINPGINPEEVSFIVDYLKDLVYNS